MSTVLVEQTLPPDTILQGYSIERVLGIGGFGVTYLARHRRLGSPVAIKEYMPRDFSHRTSELRIEPNSRPAANGGAPDNFIYGLERFLKEARDLVRFRHPHIVRATDYFEANGTAYIVMEYAQGRTLQSWLGERSGAPDEDTLTGVFLPLLDGLQEVHEHGLLHRDIKPDNIYLQHDDAPLLIDFGAARSSMGARSRSWHVMVSEGYSPKEQYASSGRQGPWTDIYSVGATLMRCLSGALPASAMDRSEAFDHDEPDPLPCAAEMFAGRYTPAFLNTIDHALAYAPRDRPQSVDELRDGLSGQSDPGPRGRDGKHGTARTVASHGADPGAHGNPAPERIRDPRPEPDSEATRLKSRTGPPARDRRVASAPVDGALPPVDMTTTPDPWSLPTGGEPTSAEADVEVVPPARDDNRMKRSKGHRLAIPLLVLVPLALGGWFLVSRIAGIGSDGAVANPEASTDAQGQGLAARRARFDDNIASLAAFGTVIPPDDARALGEAERLATEHTATGDETGALAALELGIERQERLLSTSPRDVSVGSRPEEIREALAACRAHYGADGCAPGWYEAERRRQVRLTPYALDERETSYADFAAFVEASGHSATSSERGRSRRLRSDLGVETLEGHTWATPEGPGSSHRDIADRPVAHVSWFDARAYCERRGARLPSRAEWEHAMRGVERAVHASYFDPDAHAASATAGTPMPTRAVDDPALRDERTGFYGGTGNVWEWTDTIEPTRTGRSRRVAMGGSSSEMASVNLRLASRRPEYPEETYADIGFRCASDVERWP